MTLTADQARAIADEFLEVSQVVDEYLDTHFQQMSRADYDNLNDSFRILMRASTLVTTEAVGLAINNLENPATELQNVVERTKEQIKTLQDMSRIIRLAAGLASLASGIMARDPNAIVTSVTNLRNV